MSKTTETKLNILNPDQRKELEALGTKIEKGKNALAVLAELGLGVSDLQSRLEWAEKRRAILLEKG